MCINVCNGGMSRLYVFRKKWTTFKRCKGMGNNEKALHSLSVYTNFSTKNLVGENDKNADKQT